MCIIVNVPEIIQLSSHNTFVSDIIHNTFATIPLSTIPYTDIPGHFSPIDLAQCDLAQLWAKKTRKIGVHVFVNKQDP